MSPNSNPLTMSTSTYSEAFKFLKLNGSNFPSWCLHMQSSLQAKMYWLIVDGTEMKPDLPNVQTMSPSEFRMAKKDWLDWMQQDQAAMGCIKGACEDSQLPFIIGCKSSSETWSKLMDIHKNSQNQINVHYWFEELYTKKYTDGTSMADHIASMLELKHNLKQAGKQIPDLYVARAMVLSLLKTQSWDIVKYTLFELAKIDSDTITMKLQVEVNHRNRKNGTGDSALIAQGQKGKGGKGKGKGGGSWWKKGPQPNDICRKCGEKGHWASSHEEDTKKKESGNVAISGQQDLGMRSIGQVYMATDGRRAAPGLILDSTATSHMISDQQWFTKYSTSSNNDVITVGGGCKLPVIGLGSVMFKARLPKGVRTIILHGVRHVPKLGANLISLTKLTKEGLQGSFKNDWISVKSDTEELFWVTLTDDLYWINLATKCSRAVVYISSGGSLRLWHHHMGHLHLDAIHELAKKEMVEGLTIMSPRSYDHVCKGCTLSKSHKLPYPVASSKSYDKMECVVVDLTGPMSVTTWTGKHYVLVAVKVSSRWGVGDPLTTKDKAAKALKTIIARLERQANKKIVNIRSDNGSEWVNDVLSNFCH